MQSDSDDPTVTGERRALVVAVVRTPAAAATADDEEAALLLGRKREALAAIVRSRSGRVVEQWGDRTLAVWGLGTTGRRMLRLALEAVDAIARVMHDAAIGI
jgi:class 3 adenylate cyclase